MNPVTTPKPISWLDAPCGFRTIDGEFVSCEVGQVALLNGNAVLVGGFLVGDFTQALAGLSSAFFCSVA